MKIIGTEKEIAYIKNLLSMCDYTCSDCIYTKGCETDTSETCKEFILKQIEIEIIE